MLDGRCLKKEGEWAACYVKGEIFRERMGMGGKLCWREDI